MKSTIKCPNCGTAIDVNEILSHQLESEYQTKYNQKLLDVKEQYNSKYEKLQKKEESLKAEIEKGISQKLIAEKSKLEKNLRQQIDEEKSEEIKSYKEQLDIKIQEAKSLNKLKADFERLQREKNEMAQKLEAESELKLTQRLAAERKKIMDESENQSQLKIKEKEIIINQLTEQLKSAQKKAEAGSMQLQGEAQEIAIEDYLQENFPTDIISEIKKGARGADCLHVVNSGGVENCGSIYYESKRTKDFQNSWLEKFKNDMRQANATFGVLVTDNFPKDMSRLGQKNGIWICSFEEFKGLSFVLRESVVLLRNSVVAQENKAGKMEMLYEFLTGNEFRMQVEAIVEGFTMMQSDLGKERRAMELLWKQREKQIQKVLLSTTQMYGSIKGIAGKAIGEIKALELPPTNEE